MEPRIRLRWTSLVLSVLAIIVIVGWVAILDVVAWLEGWRRVIWLNHP